MEDNQDNKALAESMGYKLVDDAEKNESTESVDTESSLKENSDNPESSETKSVFILIFSVALTLKAFLPPL